MKILFYLLIPIAALLNTGALAFLKFGAEDVKISGGIVDIAKSTWRLFVGLAFFGFAFILSTVLNKKLDATFVYPVYSGLTFLFLSILMIAILKKEPMSVLKGVGMVVIITGVILMSIPAKK